jgi:hypothetical protein
MSVKYRAHQLADQLLHMPRNEDDIEAAKLLRQMAEVYEAARDVVLAKTHEQSKAAYAELIDIFKGKKND